MARAAQWRSSFWSESVGFSSGKYTRAESDHPVIDNRKVYEILHCFQALDPLTFRIFSDLKSEL